MASTQGVPLVEAALAHPPLSTRLCWGRTGGRGRSPGDGPDKVGI